MQSLPVTFLAGSVSLVDERGAPICTACPQPPNPRMCLDGLAGGLGAMLLCTLVASALYALVALSMAELATKLPGGPSNYCRVCVGPVSVRGSQWLHTPFPHAILAPSRDCSQR